MKKPLIFLLVLFCGIFSMTACKQQSEESVTEKACLEIKSAVYKNYNEIPDLDAEIIYKNEKDYIVVVRFTLEKLDYKGSYACHIYGSKDNFTLLDNTKELGYEYDYLAYLEELTALFALDCDSNSIDTGSLEKGKSSDDTTQTEQSTDFNAPIPCFLNRDAEDVTSILEGMGYSAEKFPVSVTSESVQEVWFENFGVNFPSSAVFIKFINIDAPVRIILTAFAENEAIAYYGMYAAEQQGNSSDNFWNIIDFQNLGNQKYSEPMRLAYRGVDKDGNFYDTDVYEREVFEFEEFNLQVCGVYLDDDVNKVQFIPMTFAFVRNDAAIVEGHVGESAIFQHGTDYNMPAEFSDGTETDYSDFSKCPFSQDDLVSASKRDDWYDNGIFSAYVDEVYPNQTWEYMGTTTCELAPNPYSYNGYDVYRVEDIDRYCWFLVPYPSLTPAPLVYVYDMASNNMKLVFRNGDILG